MSSHDDLGDRIKEYEAAESQRKFLRYLPIVARLDGRGFSTFTKGLERPFDLRMTTAMSSTLKWLIENTGARFGHTQSDEMTVAWYEPDRKSKVFFDRRIQKMNSVLAGMVSVHFFSQIRDSWPSEYWTKLPHFDCRVSQYPILEEAANVFVWRENDAHKNSVSMAAQHYYKHAFLQHKSSNEMQELLFQKGINYNDYPVAFKSGTFFQRKTVLRKFEAGVDGLPERHNARRTSDLVVERSIVRPLEMPRFTRVLNRVDVIFRGADPEFSIDPANPED